MKLRENQDQEWFIYLQLIYSIFARIYVEVQVHYEKKKNNLKDQVKVVLDHFFLERHCHNL